MAIPRPILVAHRWLGVIIGLVMTLWCLSGFVMMYVEYPRLTPAEQLRGLPELELPAPGVLRRITLSDATSIASAKVEMVGGRSVLRIVPATDMTRSIPQMRTVPSAYDLSTGAPLEPLTPEELRRVADQYGIRAGIAGPATAVTRTDIDQWTVQTFRRNQPLYRIDYADGAGTTAYVSGATGEIVQHTTRSERFWSWLGAVPHWLYPTLLRQDGALWTQVVIWTSLIGCFLTITGLWVGVARLRTRRDGSFGSPYKGLWWWHHMTGLIFGALTLTWVASGLFSMNPWGFLDSSAGLPERQRLAGTLTWGDLRQAIERLTSLPPDTVRIESAPLAGRTFTLAVGRDGKLTRFDAAGRAATLQPAALTAALRNGPPVTSLDELTTADDYYYPHKTPVKLPVYRAILADDQATRLYIDADSGTLLRAIDADGRGFRWLQNGLHSFDFAFLRARPLWDLAVLPLLAMVTLVCGTGAWMGLRKLVRDLRRLPRRRRKIRARTHAIRHHVVEQAQPVTSADRGMA